MSFFRLRSWRRHIWRLPPWYFLRLWLVNVPSDFKIVRLLISGKGMAKYAPRVNQECWEKNCALGLSWFGSDLSWRFLCVQVGKCHCLTRIWQKDWFSLDNHLMKLCLWSVKAGRVCKSRLLLNGMTGDRNPDTNIHDFHTGRCWFADHFLWIWFADLWQYWNVFKKMKIWWLCRF